MPRLAEALTGAGTGAAGALVGGRGGGGPYPRLDSSTAIQYSPQIFSAKMVQRWYPATVFGEIANTDYAGDISQMGDSVVIRQTPGIVISTYTIGMDLEYETPSAPSVLLEIDKGESFAFALEDVQRFQADIDLLTDWSESAAEELKTKIDKQILADIFVDADPANSGNAAGAISGDINLGAATGTGTGPVTLRKTDTGGLGASEQSIIDYLVDLGNVLDEQNCPESDRWALLPANLCALIKKSELKDASLAGDGTSIARNGRLGTIDRMTLYCSNQLNFTANAGVKEFDIMAGHKSALTFAAQMDQGKTMILPNPNKHGHLVRGLAIYGHKVIKPEALVHGVVIRG